MNYQLCGRCRGTKNVKGIGFMDIKCPECGGSGYIERELTIKVMETSEDAPQKVNDDVEAVPAVVVKKKASGPKKSVIDEKKGD